MTESTTIDVSVVIPSHNPDIGRLLETLRGLRGQSLATDRWETLLVDNASTAFPPEKEYAGQAPANLRVMAEPRLGLTSARISGIRAARGATVVLVDDDNVLAPGYLAEVARIFALNERLGAAGGKSLPTFESPPAPWLSEFLPLLAIRDLGDAELLATSFRPEGSARNEYPAFAPIGAGMAVRRGAALAWADSVERDPKRRRLDRSGLELVSGGDNDIVMTLLEQGWSVGYFPSLSLRHLIPASRLDVDYLARLNRAIQKSWVQVLTIHDANPWHPIAASTLPLRKLKAWFTRRAWNGPAERIRWRGACGHFEGRATWAGTDT
jgi:glycosyltransferase involved in cell wall biosynthesis